MKFRKFSLKHLTLISFIPSLAVWGILTAVNLKDPSSAPFNGLAAFLVLLAASTGLKKYNSVFMEKAKRSLYNDCDPYPMINELTLYAECAGRRADKTALAVSLSMMLCVTGDFVRAEETLLSVDTRESSRVSEAVKASVLYNLAALYCSMNLREHAIDCYDRAKEAFSRAPEHFRNKVTFDSPIDAEVECYKGNIDTALEILDGVRADCRYKMVVKTFSLAKVHYIAGRPREAIDEFKWVAENGGLLACAKEAGEIAAAAEERS
ncbi:MAG: hypothetical protein IKN38_08100 [Clostridia bacterium]|nr:hypothetical protein [Clostridia bacterium]